MITPSLTWCATASAAIYLVKPLFSGDVDPDTFCVMPETILARLTPCMRAVVIVHYGGHAIDVKALRGAARVRGDRQYAVHAFGARYADGMLVGSSGILTCFSFYEQEPLDRARVVRASRSLTATRRRRIEPQDNVQGLWTRGSALPARQLDDRAGIRELGYKMNYTDLQAVIVSLPASRNSTRAGAWLRRAMCRTRRGPRAGEGTGGPRRGGPFQAPLRGGLGPGRAGRTRMSCCSSRAEVGVFGGTTRRCTHAHHRWIHHAEAEATEYSGTADHYATHRGGHGRGRRRLRDRAPAGAARGRRRRQK